MQSPNLSQSQRQRAGLEEALKEQVKANGQQARLIWLLVHQLGGVVTIDESMLNPLFELDFARTAGDQSPLLTVTAKTMPEPSELQLKLLGDRLANTGRHPGEDMLAVGLENYPISYITKLLYPTVRMEDGGWMRVDKSATP